MIVIIDDIMIESLRKDIEAKMSKSRYTHTLGVERAVVDIGENFFNEQLNELRVAALLHDITKEYSFEKQLKICDTFGIILRDDEKNIPEVLHGITAAALITDAYPEYVTNNIISSIRWHTTGCADMTLFDKILCLADYIEDGRTHPGCVFVRQYFKLNICQASQIEEKTNVLNTALLYSLNNTIEYLEKSQKPINRDTIEARNMLTNI